MSRISYRKVCVDFRNHSPQAETLSAHSQISHFKNGRQEVIVKKYNFNKRPKITLKSSNIRPTNLWIHNALHLLLI